jgi:2-(1,2-epoxy-1,2-dihydrophenyl)acetyl-CoA isomerase
MSEEPVSITRTRAVAQVTLNRPAQGNAINLKLARELEAAALECDKAQEMLLTNRRIGASEAERIGLVTRVVDDESLAEEGAKLASTLAQSATRALGATRSLILEAFDSSFDTQLAREARAISDAGKGRESIEGISAFFSKRLPNFTGA